MTCLERLFKDALAWGSAYGPTLGAEQWHTLANEQAKQFAARATPSVLSDDARECLLDVISHHDNIVAGFAAQRLEAVAADEYHSVEYWNREIAVAHRMKEQAERAIAARAPKDQS